jgi:hypothetical protein
VALDLGGPAEVVTSFDHGAKREQQLELLDRIWLLDHPRLADVLEAIGAHQPVKPVAKAARRALFRHHSRPAGPSAQRP